MGEIDFLFILYFYLTIFFLLLGFLFRPPPQSGQIPAWVPLAPSPYFPATKMDPPKGPLSDAFPSTRLFPMRTTRRHGWSSTRYRPCTTNWPRAGVGLVFLYVWVSDNFSQELTKNQHQLSQLIYGLVTRLDLSLDGLCMHISACVAFCSCEEPFFVVSQLSKQVSWPLAKL